MKIQFIVIWFCIAIQQAWCQQDPMVTQFMFNKMAVNPAYAGHEKYTGFTMMYRDQWNGVPGAPKSFNLSVNLPRFGDKIGVGINLSSQSIGIFRANTIAGYYAYRLLLEDDMYISMGIEASGRLFNADFTNSQLLATHGLENDPSIPKNKVSRFLFNSGLGIYFNAKNYYIGLSAPRIIQGDLDFDVNRFTSEEEAHFRLIGGSTFHVKKQLDLQPQVQLRYTPNAPISADINLSAIIDDKYTAGLTYRSGGSIQDIGESLALIFGFQVTNKLFFGFSNDFTLSQLRRYDSGSIELIMAYSLGKKVRNIVVTNPRYF